MDGLIEAWRETLPSEDRVTEDDDNYAKLETPVTNDTMERVAGMAACVRPEDVRYLSVGRPLPKFPSEPPGTEILLDWRQSGLAVGGGIKEPRIRAFAERLSIGYRRVAGERGPRPRWSLDSVNDLPAFLRAVQQLVGPGATVSVFGAEFPPGLLNLNGASLQPYEECDELSHLHIPLTTENIDALEPMLTPEVVKRTFITFFIMREGKELLHCGCYCDTDVYMDIPKKRIDEFCRELGMKRLRRWRTLWACS